MSDFASSFAKEYKGWMSSHGVKQFDIAHELERTEAYVSERVSGKRPLDTLDVSALAELTHIPPRDLMIELAQRTRSRLNRTVVEDTNSEATEEEAMAHRR